MEIEKKSAYSWEDYVVQPWIHFFFTINGPTAGYDLPLRVILWNGRQIDLGNFEKPKLTIRVNSWRGLWVLLRPNLNAIGEAYMNEQIDIDGELEDVVRIGCELVQQLNPTESKFEKYLRYFNHSRLFDQQSVRFHYDLSNDFYRLWLDEHMVYSCAYFENGTETLGEAQLKKVDHILNKIQLKPSMTLLEIGCGWGTAVIRAAQKYGARCVGVTISQAQYDLAVQRVKDAGLQDRVKIYLQDYRDVEGQFDRVISIGMYEHVGHQHLVDYFKKLNSLLKPDGFALNHGLNSRTDTGFSGGTEFVQRYIFPGSYLPALGEAVQACEDGGFEILDIENLRKHYTLTMTNWAKNFEKQSSKIREMIGEAKYRAYRLYLGASVQSFVTNNVTVQQFLIHKSGRHPDKMPKNRRFIYQDIIGEQV
ncbi:Class I SAM-dependent methyltransferase [Aphelenchoides bicaudatus]|nr:Class I SAM-dependent methyltransferase [Aphelenchoides bicaudatus]